MRTLHTKTLTYNNNMDIFVEDLKELEREIECIKAPATKIFCKAAFNYLTSRLSAPIDKITTADLPEEDVYRILKDIQEAILNANK